jgi:hypothetical protein
VNLIEEKQHAQLKILVRSNVMDGSFYETNLIVEAGLLVIEAFGFIYSAKVGKVAI